MLFRLLPESLFSSWKVHWFSMKNDSHWFWYILLSLVQGPVHWGFSMGGNNQHPQRGWCLEFVVLVSCETWIWMLLLNYNGIRSEECWVEPCFCKNTMSVWTYSYMYVYIYIICICISICICKNICMCMWMLMWMCMHMGMRMRMRRYRRICLCTCISICMHKYIHIIRQYVQFPFKE